MTTKRAQHKVAAAGRCAADLCFTAHGTDKLRNVERFNYLGRILSYGNNNVPAIHRKLKRARATWRRVSNILRREGFPAPVTGIFYQAMVAAVLVYGSES